MTPLAHFITKQLTLPLKRRRFNDGCAMLKNMGDVHCFECSEILGAAHGILAGIKGSALRMMIEGTSFLPAPKTWIEYVEDGYRLGFLLEADKDNRYAAITHAAARIGTDAAVSIQGSMRVPLVNGVGLEDMFRFDMVGLEKEQQEAWFLNLTVILAFINTPRIVGRQQHMPHRGLERHLIAQRGVIGKFPLHAWTEIKLDITGPKDVSDATSIEAHYTGERALHFCRSHLRLRLGRLEIVKAHWRGDASLGIKQSRYKMVAA